MKIPVELRERLLRGNVDLARHELKPDVAIWLACDLLVAGFDSPALAELAGESPTRLADREAESLLVSALTELGLAQLTDEQVGWVLARDVARRLLRGEVEPPIGANELWLVGLRHNLPELQVEVAPAEIVRRADAQLAVW